MLALEGNRIVLQGKPREPGMFEVEVVFDTLGGLAPFEQCAGGESSERFELARDGLALRGQYLRPAYVEKTSGCTIPEERSEVGGRIDPQARRIELQYRRQVFRARYSTMLFGTKCTEVAAVREAQKALNLVGRSATPPAPSACASGKMNTQQRS